MSCSGLYYHPTDTAYSNPKEFKLTHEEVTITTEDGIKLHAWHLKNGRPGHEKALILFFHGNAQNLTAHYLSLAWITSKHELLIVDYRGYGKSEGRPNPEGTHKDALAALKYAYQVSKERGFKKLIVYGQSLGGMVALRGLLDFEHRDEVDLLVLDSTFSSYQDVAFDKMKSIWLTFLFSPLAYVMFSDEMATQKRIGENKIPTLVIHSVDDQVIPYKFGDEIYNQLKSKKWLWKLKGARHIQIYHGSHESYRKKFLEFIQTL